MNLTPRGFERANAGSKTDRRPDARDAAGCCHGAGACQGAAPVGHEGSWRRTAYLKVGCRTNQKRARPGICTRFICSRSSALQNKARVHDKEGNAANDAADQKHTDDFFEIHRSPQAVLCEGKVIPSRMARLVTPCTQFTRRLSVHNPRPSAVTIRYCTGSAWRRAPRRRLWSRRWEQCRYSLPN